MRGYGVVSTCYPFIPNAPGIEQVRFLIGVLSNYDMAIVQRCYLRQVIDPIKAACEFLGIPLIFETDDDYLNLPPSNPAYYGMLGPNFFEKDVNGQPHLKSGFSRAELEYHRQVGLNEYRTILGMVDGITVSTEELKRTLAPYNRCIKVLQNNVPQVWDARDNNNENDMIDPNNPGRIRVENDFGLWRIPNYYRKDDQSVQVPRIGYTGTVSHRGEDFDTVQYYWDKLIEKYGNSCWFVYIGDKHFYDQHEFLRKRKDLQDRNLYIPPSYYEMYMFNYRNLDVAIAPLITNVFNMAKSDIKAVEAASWGIPSVLPNYITYTRNFKHGETCLTYSNGREFMECVEALILDPKLRLELGENAREYVRNNRLERIHAPTRLDFYQSFKDNMYRLEVFGSGSQENKTLQESSTC